MILTSSANLTAKMPTANRPRPARHRSKVVPRLGRKKKQFHCWGTRQKSINGAQADERTPPDSKTKRQQDKKKQHERESARLAHASSRAPTNSVARHRHNTQQQTFHPPFRTVDPQQDTPTHTWCSSVHHNRHLHESAVHNDVSTLTQLSD